MKVRECEKCEHYERRVWSHRHYCRNYHDIGMTHAYGYCKKYECRCADVKKCEENEQ